jgi:hypothetical protein
VVTPSDDQSASARTQYDDVWPPDFPQAEIERLIDHLEQGQSLDEADTFLLITLVVRETRRIRATTARLATAQLSADDQQAREIVAEARRTASEVRDSAYRDQGARIDQGERLLAAMREALRVELRASRESRAERGR